MASANMFGVSVGIKKGKICEALGRGELLTEVEDASEGPTKSINRTRGLANFPKAHGFVWTSRRSTSSRPSEAGRNWISALFNEMSIRARSFSSILAAL